jgi:hypothetical protein
MTMTTEERLAQAIADRDYWREQATGMAPCVDEIRRLTRRVVRGGTGCVVDPERVVAAVAALRAIVEGRAEAPAPAEATAHAASGGAWLIAEPLETQDGRPLIEKHVVELRLATAYDCNLWRGYGPEPIEGEVIIADDLGMGVTHWWADGTRWWPLDATGRPTTWPTDGAP